MVADPLAAGDAVVFHLLEYVEPFISAGDGIGHHLAGQVGDVDAVAGIALGVEDVFIQPADMRDTIDHDADLAAPFIVDTRTSFKLWEISSPSLGIWIS